MCAGIARMLNPGELKSIRNLQGGKDEDSK